MKPTARLVVVWTTAALSCNSACFADPAPTGDADIDAIIQNMAKLNGIVSQLKGLLLPASDGSSGGSLPALGTGSPESGSNFTDSAPAVAAPSMNPDNVFEGMPGPPVNLAGEQDNQAAEPSTTATPAFDSHVFDNVPGPPIIVRPKKSNTDNTSAKTADPNSSEMIWEGDQRVK